MTRRVEVNNSSLKSNTDVIVIARSLGPAEIYDICDFNSFDQRNCEFVSSFIIESEELNYLNIQILQVSN